MKYTDFKLGEKYLSNFNGTIVYEDDSSNINISPEVTHITENSANREGKVYYGCKIQPRVIDLKLCFEFNVDIQELVAWLCPAKQQTLQFVDDDKEIDVIYNGAVDLVSYNGDYYKGILDISFIAYNPYFRIVNERENIISEPILKKKYSFKTNATVKSMPLIKIVPDGLQKTIFFKFNGLPVELKNISKEIYINSEIEEVYEYSLGQKMTAIDKFYSTDFMDFPIINPFAINSIEVQEGAVKGIVITPNSRIL